MKTECFGISVEGKIPQAKDSEDIRKEMALRLSHEGKIITITTIL